MVDLAMSIFEFLNEFLIFWHPWHPWVCIRSDLKPLFETNIRDSSYCVLGIQNEIQAVCLPIVEQDLEIRPLCHQQRTCYEDVRNARRVPVEQFQDHQIDATM